MQSESNNNASPAAPPALQPLKGPALLLLTIAAALSTFMEILDITIANVSIPTIAGALGVSTNQGTWIISAYSVAAAIAVPLTGWLARRVGEVKLFVMSVLAFTLMSALAAFSVNLPMLVVFRLLQGLVSGPMVPLSQTLLVRNFPPEKRGAAMGLWAMTVILAPIAGPLLGGYISDNYHWSWIFLINIPIGLFGGITIWTLMRKRESATVKMPLDVVGLLLLVVGVGSLQLMLEIGKDYDWFASPFITALGVIAVVALTFFIAWVLTSDHPIVELQLFRDKNFRYGVILLSVGFMTYFGSVVIFPLWLQLVMGYTSAQAGAAMAPIGIFTLILSPIIGKNIARLNLRALATFAFIVMGAVSLWNTQMSLEVGFWDIVNPRLVQGIGMACFFLPVQSLMLSNITPDHMAGASGLSNFLRTLGAAMGTAISVTMWEHLATDHHSRLVENVSHFSPASNEYLGTLQAGGLSLNQAFAVVERTINAQSYMLATDDFFLYCSVAFFALTSLVWLTKPKKGVAAAVGH
ncbi:DHA2 family efflux MFS transporter permease subunit [Noviherbaspirillum sp. UKPF54]|uniref:DHA2 family efflux MFS transporter permease subunit n=1 Tax=Noviherbaspirillum sp. UKPF54 TaxID=2601898 RepID=UPI0011B19E6D|nr:DHA2 family efflux MFS transporter permease subunit [Noviherbaspirillum sp. UKPF54]QDZ27417.1 DHA2 family efflux MFS transporter permease subunit [Noviherbaspirillum sp. UKPF54]